MGFEITPYYFRLHVVNIVIRLLISILKNGTYNYIIIIVYLRLKN